MFEKVLIANRGEIACRVLRTLRALGAKSVAVYSEVDRHARHVLEADEAICIGPAAASKSYLNADAIVAAARRTGAGAIHPGYGFLSENHRFATLVEASGIAFVGPTPRQLHAFGLKHEARALAEGCGVPLLPGTKLLDSLDAAMAAANSIGYPVILKSTAGGGGIGMKVCRTPEELPALFQNVENLARKNFAEGGVYVERYVERARHIEVQIFGDGSGNVIALGERDCSAQRRHQKVIEECPAPRLSDTVRGELHSAAVRLGRAVNYRSAGTVEFVYDDAAQEFYFLEVNARLQVEHGVTELVYGVDLVEWMLRLAAGESLPLEGPSASGHAIEVRLYAEDPARDFKPCAGTLTEVVFPNDVRVDSWIELGTEISGFYDPMLAKVVAHGPTREVALQRLTCALDATRLAGVETNLHYLTTLLADEAVRRGLVTTNYLSSYSYRSRSVEVLAPGTMTTVQDFPGRVGFWAIGIPPSGPMDDLSFRLVNRIVGNSAGATGLEFAATGPTLAFATDCVIALGGADFGSTLDDVAIPRWAPIAVRAGQVLKIGTLRGSGARGYLAVRHGFDVPTYLGSRSTFTLGGFGGHGGRALRKGDVLRLEKQGNVDAEPEAIDSELTPTIGDEWEIGVTYGPHGAPDFFRPSDIETLFSTAWEVHYNSARTGVRLIGPKPEWARTDGGEAGLHPSNLHDNAYAIGAIDFTGDMPILLGPDGPSLGGFVCPATVVAAERWKLGQLKPGASVRFVPLSIECAEDLERQQLLSIDRRRAMVRRPLLVEPIGSAVLRSLDANALRPLVTYRASGDKYLLVEYGPMTLDLSLRFRVHQLMERIASERHAAIIDLTPGIRSLQLHYDNLRLPRKDLLRWLERLEDELPPLDALSVSTRVVHLPLSWDDPATRLAIEKYMQVVRKDAPWTPSNLEFIRRINGLESIEAVRDIVFGASYLVLGLGDVYLGAPVATPVDPRHRLVTTKYNPARTWTPENAVGIGGAYLCVYGMEGPGGYQFVGRTLQVFNRYKTTRHFVPGHPWLLRCFDQIRFYPVTAAELLEMREAFPRGRFELDITEERFELSAYSARLAADRASIARFKAKQQGAFDAERARWAATEATRDDELRSIPQVRAAACDGADKVESHVHGSVWKVLVTRGVPVRRGDVLVVLDSMKMEIGIEAPFDGTIVDVMVSEGQAVTPGYALMTLMPTGSQA
jgi:urea carboxylase